MAIRTLDTTLKNWLKDEVLLKIAQENAVAETAFFVRKGKNFHLRWFTPDIEMDLCGHATLATAHCIFPEKVTMPPGNKADLPEILEPPTQVATLGLAPGGEVETDLPTAAPGVMGTTEVDPKVDSPEILEPPTQVATLGLALAVR